MFQKSRHCHIFIIACLSALLCVSCGNDSPDHLASIPQSSILWLTVDFDDVMADPALMGAMSMDEITTELEALGIPPNEVSKLTVFGIYQSGVLSDGALVTGRYRAKQILKRLSEAGWEEEAYKNDKLYRNPQQTEVYIAVLYNDTVLFGSRDALKATFDVKRKRGESLMQKSETLLIVNDSMSSEAPITMGLLMPQETLDMAKAAMSIGKTALDILQVPVIGTLLGKIGFTQGFGIHLRHGGNEFLMELLCLMENESSASFISGSLNLMKNLATSLPQGQMTTRDREAIATFRKMNISREGKMLSIEMVIPEREFVRMNR
ncbi:MAG: hypothetical protein O7E52_09110 [Candidatus Poribacteria bacterium]|nr:hypothetical protein [Candidatus Poribacteria bacterium]